MFNLTTDKYQLHLATTSAYLNQGQETTSNNSSVPIGLSISPKRMFEKSDRL